MSSKSPFKSLSPSSPSESRDPTSPSPSLGGLYCLIRFPGKTIICHGTVFFQTRISVSLLTGPFSPILFWGTQNCMWICFLFPVIFYCLAEPFRLSFLPFFPMQRFRTLFWFSTSKPPCSNCEPLRRGHVSDAFPSSILDWHYPCERFLEQTNHEFWNPFSPKFPIARHPLCSPRPPRFFLWFWPLSVILWLCMLFILLETNPPSALI